MNTVHHTAQATTNHVQNAGVAELSDRDDFVGRDSLYGHINNRFRDLLSAARPYLDRFEEFRASVVDNEEEIIDELTQVGCCIDKRINHLLPIVLFSVIVYWLQLLPTKPAMTLLELRTVHKLSKWK